jgi:hypothetical protein
MLCADPGGVARARSLAKRRKTAQPSTDDHKRARGSPAARGLLAEATLSTDSRMKHDATAHAWRFAAGRPSQRKNALNSLSLSFAAFAIRPSLPLGLWSLARRAAMGLAIRSFVGGVFNRAPASRGRLHLHSVTQPFHVAPLRRVGSTTLRSRRTGLAPRSARRQRVR